MDELADRAYHDLYGRSPKKQMRVEYNGRMRNYNAHVTSTITTITFTLSKEFLEVDDEIRIGVMQHLLCKLRRRRKGEKPKQTLEMDLYNRFLKNIGEYQSAGGGSIQDAELQSSFDRVNKEYFDDYLLQPTIMWRGKSTSHLGQYTFSDDTITISNALRGAGELLDYVVYHELLHKKHKFDHKAGRTHSHTPAFRRDEKKFTLSDGREPEKALNAYLRTLSKQRRGSSFDKRLEQRRKKGVIRRLWEYF